MRRGFSLIELMIVIIILGLLASLVLPNLMGQASGAKKDLVCVQMKQLSNILDSYQLDNGVLPSTEEGLEALVSNPDPDTYINYRASGYIKEGQLPKDPWKRPYIYINDGSTLDMISLGADGKEGGEGENADITYAQCKQK
ncbi:MAG: general secretion pathway protein GspG [Sulfuricurvum sp. PC08-66]|nr:MAG: general secretion pathway protein GspG [Sulfuricurvum sp. PC08-66]